MRPNPLLFVIAAIVVLIVADSLLSRWWSAVPANTWVTLAIVGAVVAYMVIMIASRGAVRFSLPKRRRMRVVKRDPSAAAADFIKQFEDRAKR